MNKQEYYMFNVIGYLEDKLPPELFCRKTKNFVFTSVIYFGIFLISNEIILDLFNPVKFFLLPRG